MLKIGMTIYLFEINTSSIIIFQNVKIHTCMCTCTYVGHHNSVVIFVVNLKMSCCNTLGNTVLNQKVQPSFLGNP